MDLPDWLVRIAIKVGVGVGLVGLIIVLGWISTRLRPPRPKNCVRMGAFIVGTGLFAAAVGILLTYVLVNHQRMVGPGQFGPFLGVWALFVFGSIWLLLETRQMVFHDDFGIRWRTHFSNWKTARWDEIVDSRYVGWKQAIVLELANGSRIEISEYSDGLDSFTDAAYRAGILKESSPLEL
jgi:hypothetical protein